MWFDSCHSLPIFSHILWDIFPGTLGPLPTFWHLFFFRFTLLHWSLPSHLYLWVQSSFLSASFSLYAVNVPTSLSCSSAVPQFNPSTIPQINLSLISYLWKYLCSRLKAPEKNTERRKRICFSQCNFICSPNPTVIFYPLAYRKMIFFSFPCNKFGAVCLDPSQWEINKERVTTWLAYSPFLLSA